MVSPAPPAPAPSNARLLAPLAPAFHILNWIAFFGWSHVLYQVISFYYYYSWLYHSKKDDADDGRAQLLQLLLQETKYTLILLEGICVVEVGRIFFKDLPGNLTLGVILHTIRITALVEVLPRAVSLASSRDATEWTWTAPVVLLSWAVTEVGRYPMYMLPSNRACRAMRLVLPLLTFPIGAFAEFCAAYQVFFGKSISNLPLWLQFLLILMMLVNGVLGPYLAYPHLLKKGLPVLGLSVARTSAPPSSSAATNKKPKRSSA